MFTGIIQTTAKVVAIKGEGIKRVRFSVPFGFTRRLRRGASVAFDGVCLTAVRKGLRSIEVDVMSETIAKTTFATCRVGDRMNVERSFRVGDEVGGHVISGHVSGLATIVDRRTENGTTVMRFEVPNELRARIQEKGFIALNGASLTVSNYRMDEGLFDIFFIPETLLQTTFDEKQVGDTVNIETDKMFESTFGYQLPSNEVKKLV